MRGDLLIDNTDVYTTYGVGLQEGSLCDLLSMPSFKSSSVYIDNWQEYDGVEVSLSHAVLDVRQVTLTFYCTMASRIGGFIGMLTTQSSHTVQYVPLGRSYTMRMVSISAIRKVRRLGIFSVTFAEVGTMQFPTVRQSPYPVSVSAVKASGYWLHGIDIARYGVSVLQGTDASVLKPADVKGALERSVSNVAGHIYDTNAPVRHTTKEVVLNLLIYAEKSDFWQRYDTFMSTLASHHSEVGGNIFSVVKYGRDYGFYYKKATAKEVVCLNGKIWCKMELSIVLTDWPGTERNLLTETPQNLMTQTNNDIYIG